MSTSYCIQVKLKDSVVSALQFSKAKDIELAWIDARLDLSKAKTDTSATYVNENGVTMKQITGGITTVTACLPVLSCCLITL